ncbi:MAG: hypothetical protein KDA75_00990 [Planctomycetaceae bacterium]|nr:hypothetical protein [Planctomycetaceae bacterium]
MTPQSEILVDCHGIRIDESEVTVVINGVTWRFVLDVVAKRWMQFHFGLFANTAVHSPAMHHYPRERRLCGLFESPIHNCYANVDRLIRDFPLIFTHQRCLLERGPPFVELMFGTNWVDVRTSDDSKNVLDVHPPKDRLVSFIGSVSHPQTGAYALRQQVSEHLLRRGDVDCFGKGVREIQNKRVALAPYWFSVAMENAASDCYFTEKLVDCLLMETVPIYYGCPGIESAFDGDGLLPFRTIDELDRILNGLTPDRYESMLPALLRNKVRAIERNWHSHRGLLSRIADLTAESLIPPDQRLLPVRGGLWRRLTSFVSAV